MPNGIIHQLGDGNPSREILKAAADLLNAVISQYPRAAKDMKNGVSIRIITAGGAQLEIAGQASDTPLLPGMNGGIVG